ncbi:MAG: hypothetical protein ABR544_05230 [Gammaproteobacteria bacterium]
MNESSLPYGIILLGCGLAFLSAVVPHYDTGYYLMTGVLLAGLLPYLVYALAAALMKGPLVLAGGLVILVLHGILVVNERVLGGAGYESGMIYYAPLLLAILGLPLLLRTLREPWR